MTPADHEVARIRSVAKAKTMSREPISIANELYYELRAERDKLRDERDEASTALAEAKLAGLKVLQALTSFMAGTRERETEAPLRTTITNFLDFCERN